MEGAPVSGGVAKAPAAARRLVVGLAVVLVAETLTAAIGAAAVGWSFTDALNDYVVSNSVIGLSFGLCGVVIAWHRWQHPVGWLYAIGGTLMLATAADAPVTQALHNASAPDWVVRLGVTVADYTWAWHIGVVLPLSLLLLPDGALPSPRWRPVFWAVAVTAPLFIVEIGASPDSPAPGLPPGYLTIGSYNQLHLLWNASELRWSISMLIGVAALMVRYRRGDERLRRQLLWLLAPAVAVLVAVLPWALIAGTPIVVLFAIPLLPIGIAVGILRHQLLDIRLVIARAAAYALLSTVVLGVYALLVIVLSGVASALIAALVALPLRNGLQRAIERLFYGERRDPLRVASRVGERLGGQLTDSLDEIRAALRLPYVAIAVDGGPVASAGTAPAHLGTVDLVGEGELIVGLRQGERRLALADERVLRLLAAPLATALRATRLSDDLQLSRERLIAAREEERRRLRRDLHDGLGPLLTGVAMSADAAANLNDRAPGQAAELLGHVRKDSRTAITEIRRIIDDLRPPSLERLGLIGAIEERAARTRTRVDGAPIEVIVDCGAKPLSLPAAIEVAAYRIATEAITNTVRHSDASRVVIRVNCDEALVIEVDDDGSQSSPWTAGVGISGIRDRVAEVGGRCRVGPTADGGRVHVALPLVSA
jgi:signal transduction histidine kinase